MSRAHSFVEAGGADRQRSRSAAFSPIIRTATIGLTVGMLGKTDASAIRTPDTPRSRSSGSTTASSSSAAPIRQVPAGWKTVNAARR